MHKTAIELYETSNTTKFYNNFFINIQKAVWNICMCTRECACPET